MGVGIRRRGWDWERGWERGLGLYQGLELELGQVALRVRVQHAVAAVLGAGLVGRGGRHADATGRVVGFLGILHLLFRLHLLVALLLVVVLVLVLVLVVQLVEALELVAPALLLYLAAVLVHDVCHRADPGTRDQRRGRAGPIQRQIGRVGRRGLEPCPDDAATSIHPPRPRRSFTRPPVHPSAPTRPAVRPSFGSYSPGRSSCR